MTKIVTVDNLLAMPHAEILMQEAQKHLDKEKEVRKHFYSIVDENKKMEFINGEIMFQSPVKKEHNEATGNLYFLLKGYVRSKKLGWVAVEKALVSLTRNDYEPDVCFWKNEKAKNFTDKQMQFPAPDFVVEVLSPKTEKHDRTTKFADYEAHFVKEYWIVDASKRKIEQYVLINGKYMLRFNGDNGTIESEAIKGFNFDVSSIFNSNSDLLATLNRMTEV